jgi:peptidoglycan/xylan/chitin deacetylase (PgdA/CDA1 family)
MTVESHSAMNLKHICLKLLSSDHASYFLRWALLKRKIVILMYHEVLEDEREIDAWTVIRTSDFFRQMEFLKRHFDVISLDESIRLLQGGGRGSGGRPKAVVTFDDGYSGNARCVLPVIETLEIPITIFVATKAVETGTLYWYDKVILALQSDKRDIDLNFKNFELGSFHLQSELSGELRWTVIQSILAALKTLFPYQREDALRCVFEVTGESKDDPSGLLAPMSVEQVKRISKSPFVTIGAHSHCHNLLVQLGYDEALESVESSKRLLEQWTGSPIRFFAYPNGDFNAQVVKAVSKSGFKCALTTIGRPAKVGDDLFMIPRTGIGRYDSEELFAVRLLGIL